MVLKRVAVTGASGMTGRHLLAELSARGIEVVAVSRNQGPELPGVNWRSWDLRDWKTSRQLSEIFGSVDALFHVGAAVPSRNQPLTDTDLLAANVTACRAVGLWAAEQDTPLLFLSGGIVYAPSPAPIDETQPRTSTPEGGLYGLSKVLAEQILENLVPAGLPLTILRASSIYGWGLGQDKMIPSFLARAAAGEIIQLAPPVEDRINLIHAADVARAMVLAAQKSRQGCYNLAAPTSPTLLELVQACVAIAGGTVEITGAPPSRAPIDRFPLDVGKARDHLGFTAQVGLHDGLSRLMGKRCGPDGRTPWLP